MRFAKQLFLIVLAAALVVACAAAVPDEEELQGEDSAPLTGHCAKNTAGICVGKPIDAAVKCAIAKGASVISFYRSPAEQECVRRQNGCTDRCTGGAGCARPTASCTTSPHTHCHAVDLVNDGAPVSRAQLKACGLAKTTAPHENHYDLLDGVTPDKGTTGSPAKSAPTGHDPKDPSGSCHSFTLGKSVPAGTCVQRDDNDLWYVCDGANPTAWPRVPAASAPECTSCPQLPDGHCP